MAVLCLVGALLLTFFMSEPSVPAASYGTVTGWGINWSVMGSWCRYVEFVLALLAALAMVLLNKHFTFLGGMTMLFVSLTLLAVPSLSVAVGGMADGMLMALVYLVLTHMLFSLFEQRDFTTRIFTLFVIIAGFSLIESAFVWMLPLFFFGVVQVRSMSIRGILAAVFGILTPYWIVLGSGLVPTDALVWPHVDSAFSGAGAALAVAGGVLAVGMAAIGVNSFTLISYRLQLRTYNGFTLMAILWAVIMIVADSGNASLYIPVLIVNVAMQLAHCLNAKPYRRRYIAVLLIMAALITVYSLV